VRFPGVSRAWRRLRTAVERSLPAPRPLGEELEAAGASFETWFSTLDGEAATYAELSAPAVSRARACCPRESADVIEAGERLLRHEFDLLGSGPFVPDDPSRPRSAAGYHPIDWYWDPVSRLRFPRGIPIENWDLYAMRPGRADIKLPWEIGRCQHWVTLGQAFRLTGDPRFAREIADELRDFVDANPIGTAVQWACTMDVALRAANWAIGLALVRSSPELDGTFWRDAYSALFVHGGFIESHLENGAEVTSNHYLSDIVGLFFVARVFRRLPAGRRWEAFCRASLEQEIERQVLDDGADFESSIPYHRLVTELFLGGARLADHAGAPLSPAYRDRLRRMIEFHLAVMRPDGLMAQVGDADDGRLHVFTGYGWWNPQDGRHLLAPAARMFDRFDWLPHAGAPGAWEAAWWGYDVDSPTITAPPLPDTCRLFPAAGLVVVRERGHYLLVANGRVGTEGIGNHKHNDQLAFEYHVAGQPVLVDAGSLAYTGDPGARNRLRSTSSHNTLRIDGEEQNEMRPDSLFRMFERAHPEHLRFEVGDESVEYEGRHSGYRRLAAPVAHERILRFLRESGSLLVRDRLCGEGEHSVTWHFHAAPDVTIHRASPGLYHLEGRGASFCLWTSEELSGEITAAVYSPAYGVRRPCGAVELSGRISLRRRADFFFALGTREWFEGAGREQGMATLRDELLARPSAAGRAS
jgi:heparinase II/III-like protein